MDQAPRDVNRVLNTRPPGWYWAVGIAALLWSVIGVMNYIWQISLDAEALAALPAGQRTLIETAPGWHSAVFGLAVFSSLLGSVGLLMRRMWARPVFIVSLVAIIIQFGWVFLIADAMGLLGPGALILPLAIIAAAIFLVWFASLGIRRGWLR